MADNARFHNKLHRRNHHSIPSVGYPDSGSDPIASPTEPFLGDFHVVGSLSGTGNLTIGGNALVYGNLSALGDFSYVDTFVTVTSALSVVNKGTGPAFTVIQEGLQPIAVFMDDTTSVLKLKDGLRVEFFDSNASQFYAIAEGLTTNASGSASHAEGSRTRASNNATHAEGYYTSATNLYAHSEGHNSVASGIASHAENTSVASGNYSHAEGASVAQGAYSHAEGESNLAVSDSSHAEGYFNNVTGVAAHGEGSNNTVNGAAAHAEGSNNTVSNDSAHAEGTFNQVTAVAAHAEGSFTTASGNSSHAEGSNTQATGNFSHAEGGATLASGESSHAEGSNTQAVGKNSHASGAYSNATKENTTAIGVKANAVHRGATVISANTNQYNSSSFGDETFNVFASGGTHIFYKTTIGDPASAASFVVTSGGFVGINVNDPVERLTVNGNISSFGSVIGNSLCGRFVDISHTPANDGSNPYIRIGELTPGSTTLSAFSGFRIEYDEASNTLNLSSIGFTNSRQAISINSSGFTTTSILSVTTPNYANLNTGLKAPLTGSALASDNNFHLIQGRTGINTAPVSSYALHIRGGNVRVDGVDYSTASGFNGTTYDTDGQSLFDLRSASPDSNYSLSISQSGLGNFMKFFGGRLNDDKPFINVKENTPIRFGTFDTFFGTNYKEHMRIGRTGNVGIHTNHPWVPGQYDNMAPEALTVVGNISASGSINALSSNVGIVVDNKTTSYTFTNADNNCIVHFDTTSQSLCAIFPSSLRTNFNCAVMNTGTNVLTLSTYTTLRAIAPNISTQYGAAFVYKDSSNNIYAVGRL